MNIETNTGNHGNKHFSFRNMMVLIVVLISFCVQGIYLGYNGYKFNTFSEELLDDSMKLVHQSMLDNVDDVVEQVEALFTFAKWYNLASYVDANLNLRQEQYALDMLSRVEASFLQADIKPDIVDSFLMIGKNVNQKSLYYHVGKKQLAESTAFSQEILEDTGLLIEIYKSIGIPVRLPEETLEGALEAYDKTNPGYPALEQFVKRCSEHYIVMDVVSNVMMITFLDEACFTAEMDKQSNYGFALLSSDFQVIFQQGEVVQSYITKGDGQTVWQEISGGNIVQKSKVWPEDLWVVTVCESHKGYLYRHVTLPLIACMLILNLGAFVLVHYFSKKLLRPLKLFEGVMTRLREAGIRGIGTGKSTSFGKQLFISLFVSCIIPFLCMNLISNKIMNEQGNRLLKQSLDIYISCYEDAVQRFRSDCEQLSTDFAIKFIQQYKINNPSQNTELIQKFEKDVMTKVSAIPTYSYVLVTDRNYHILHQSVYSGRTELFLGFVNKVAEHAKMSPGEKQFWMVEDSVSEKNVLVFYAPVMQDGEFIGSMMIALDEQTINTYIQAPQGQPGYMLVEEDGEILGNEQYVNAIGTAELRSLAGGESDGAYRYKDFLIAPCTQTIFKDSCMLVGVNAEEYVRVLDSILLDSVIIGLILALVIVLISLFMMHLMLTPIVGMTKGFSTAGDVPQKLEINTGVTEINELILVYNNMVKRQEQLIEDNERRHENEKNLIALRSQAEFKMLQQQINPHFMFNTLEVINMLASVNHLDNISDVAKALAEILRFSLTSTQTVTVGEEIAALQNYLLIQNIRFGDRIQFITNFDESLVEYQMLKFLIQPLVENAISHGVYNKLRGGEVVVSLTAQGEFLHFCVSDNGVGMTEKELERLCDSLYNEAEEYAYSTVGSGIGLKNIYRRLRYYYGESANMVIESVCQVGTTIRLVLPREYN